MYYSTVVCLAFCVVSDVLGPRNAERLSVARKLLVRPPATAPAAAGSSLLKKSATETVLPSESAPDHSSKLPCTMVRLNNNGIENALPLYRVLSEVLLDINALTWVDLSNNRITSIGPAFAKLASLKRLYLHGNRIDKLAEVEHLQVCVCVCLCDYL